MSRLILPIIAVMVAATAACERNPSDTAFAPRPTRSLRAAQPDGAYRLSAAQRANVLTMYDADALERLLQMVRPEARDSVLRFFQIADDSGPHAVLMHLDDPGLQAVLEEVWAPYWDRLPPEAIDGERAPVPGREIARKRRAARAAPGSSGTQPE